MQFVRRYARGGRVLLEFDRQLGGGTPVEVDLPHEEVERLSPVPGEVLVVRPRRLQLFPAQ